MLRMGCIVWINIRAYIREDIRGKITGEMYWWGEKCITLRRTRICMVGLGPSSASSV